LPPEALFATPEAEVQRFGRLVVGILEQVGVDVQGCADLGMAQLLADNNKIDTGMMQEAGLGMAQGMEGDGTYASGFREGRPALAEGLRGFPSRSENSKASSGILPWPSFNRSWSCSSL
jgi:hypothetical protein